MTDQREAPQKLDDATLDDVAGGALKLKTAETPDKGGTVGSVGEDFFVRRHSDI